MGLASVATAMEQPERATRLLGSATAVRKTMGFTMWPTEEVTYARTLAATHDKLDATGWQAASGLRGGYEHREGRRLRTGR